MVSRVLSDGAAIANDLSNSILQLLNVLSTKPDSYGVRKGKAFGGAH